MPAENFGDRPQKLIEAFRALDSKKSGRIPTPLVAKVLALYAPDFSGEEKSEFFTEADDKGFIAYESFVKDIMFGKQ
jgi:Ca2+-binding EF-hand superfamily protein